jgi:dethiobiotin synthetase
MKQCIFMTSTGTGIGKSFITAALTRQAKALGRSVMAYKPVISGFDTAHADDSDTGLLLRSLDLPMTSDNIDRISPWRFSAPLAPSMAAKLEHRHLDFDQLVAHGRAAIDGREDIVLIEGIGGVMVPLDDHHTVLDWIAELDIKTLLVIGSYLGTISHTLTALLALQQRQIPFHSLIINESESSEVSLQQTADTLAHWINLPIIPVARRKADDNWRDVKELRGLIA